MGLLQLLRSSHGLGAAWAQGYRCQHRLPRFATPIARKRSTFEILATELFASATATQLSNTATSEVLDMDLCNTDTARRPQPACTEARS